MDQGLPPTEEDEVDAATGIVTSSTGAEDGEAAQAFNKTNYNITKNATINVRNGNGAEGLGSQVKDILTSMGYLGSNINVANANSTDFDTTLVVSIKWNPNKVSRRARGRFCARFFSAIILICV